MSVTWGGQSVSINTGATGSPVGAAGGDLDGAYPNPTVDGLQGRPVASTAPTAGQALVWSGTAWAPWDVKLDLPQVGPITSTITAFINGSSTASQRVWHGFLGPYTGANVTVTANRVYYSPVFIPHIQAVRNLRVLSAGTVTTGNVILGIYDSLNGVPNARQVQTSATAVASGTAYTEIGISWTPTAPGWYWLASVYSSTPTAGAQDNGNVYIQLQGHLNIVGSGRPLHGAIQTVGSHALPSTAAANLSERNNIPYMAMSYTA